MRRTKARSRFGAFGALGALAVLGALALLGATGVRGDSTAPAGPSTVSSAAPVPSVSAALGSDVLATVNGVPIRVSQVQYLLSKKDHRQGGADTALVKAALEDLVDMELARQAAVAAGLDADPAYEKKLRFLEAPYVHFQREELGERYLQRAVAARSSVDEADARKYFDEHAAELKSEFHVAQILIRNDESKIRELKKKIDGGASFEEVAATLFPANLPEGAKTPWDLGSMRWSQLPIQWRAPVGSLKDGEVSDVIAGPKGRFWLVKLVARRTNEKLTFEQLKTEVVELIKSAKGSGLGKAVKDELRQKAEIVYPREAAAMPPPPEPED
ncbi:MAG: peptidyl-prolyl cis-trans isomerase [Polyangiaceae bacterium]|nr:peptidyl-prolyl cis-trans isomerase [Polyangiaceae bacterium]